MRFSAYTRWFAEIKHRIGACRFATLPVLLVAVATCAACTRPPAASAELDELAERYVRLCLALNVHDAGAVDPYFGPAAWAEQAGREQLPLAQVGEGGRDLIRALRELPLAPGGPQHRRRAFLQRQTEALVTRGDVLSGRRMRYDEESQALFGVVAPARTAAHYDGLLEELDRTLPGSGPIAERFFGYQQQFAIPADMVGQAMHLAIDACRSRTLAFIDLPAEEQMQVELVADKPYRGYLVFRGGYSSVLYLNTAMPGLPVTVHEIVRYACHEGYPGHHTHAVLQEQQLVRQGGRVEQTAWLLLSPAMLVAEGIGECAVDLAFPSTERAAWQAEHLFPLAGADPSEADRYERVTAIFEELRRSLVDGSRAYWDGQLGENEAVDWISRYTLFPPDVARSILAGLERYRGYDLGYTVGRDLVQEHLEAVAGDNQEARWQAFAALLTSQALPSDLARP